MTHYIILFLSYSRYLFWFYFFTKHHKHLKITIKWSLIVPTYHLQKISQPIRLLHTWYILIDTLICIAFTYYIDDHSYYTNFVFKAKALITIYLLVFSSNFDDISSVSSYPRFLLIGWSLSLIGKTRIPFSLFSNIPSYPSKQPFLYPPPFSRPWGKFSSIKFLTAGDVTWEKTKQKTTVTEYSSIDVEVYLRVWIDTKSI